MHIKAVSDKEIEALLSYEIPDGKWSGTIQANDAIAQLYYAKSLKARLMRKGLDSMLNKSIAKGGPDLNMAFIFNMPIRAIGSFKGPGKLIGGFFKQQKIAKKAKSLE